MSHDNPPKQSASSNGNVWIEGVLSREGMVANMMKNSQAAFEDSFRTLSDEILQFITRRLEHNSAVIEQYRGCKDATDFMNAQQKWFADLAHDYSDEAARMSEVARKMFASALPANGHSVEKKEEKRPYA